MIPRKLTARDVHAIVLHLQRLQGEDRRLRFGGMVSDDYIVDYVELAFLDSDSQWFGCEDDAGTLVAVCHAGIDNNDAELGFSVDADYRGSGLAQSLFDRAATYVRSRGIREVYMHCLSENSVMKHIARKNQMTVVTEFGESDANVQLDSSRITAALTDAYLDRLTIYDAVMKTQIRFIKNFYA